MNAPINTAVLAKDARNIGLTPINGCPTPDALNSVVAAWNAFRKEGGNWRDAVGFAANSEGHVWVVVNPGANTGFDLWDFISKDIAAQWDSITKYLARNKRKPLLDAPSPASISDLVVDMPIQTFPACAPANLIAAHGGPAPPRTHAARSYARDGTRAGTCYAPTARAYACGRAGACHAPATHDARG